jgi:hypothetical protein
MRSNPYKAVIPLVSGIAYVPNPRPHPEQPLEVTVRSERIGTLGRDLAPGVRLISQISQTEKEVWVTHGEARLFVLLQDGLGRSSYFYQSFSGTGGKAQGAWFPSGGILADRQGRGVWVIKGSPKTDPGAGRAALLELYEKANAVLPQSDADTDRFVKKLTGVGFDEDFTYKDAYAIKPVLRILEDGSARDLQAKWGSWSYQFWALNALDKTFGKRTFNMKSNPEDLAGRHIPDRYLAGLPPALQKQRVRELTESRDAYKRGDYSELATDVTARKMGLVKQSQYTTEAKKRGIEYRGDFHDMAKRTLKFYSGRAPAREVEAFAEALRKSFSKGLAAWKSGGHRPGATAQNWAVARVNSLVVGGKTSWTADKKLFEVLPESVQAKVESMRAKSNPLTKAATRDYISQYRVEHSSTATAAELIARRSKSYSGGLIQTRGSAAARSPQTVQEMSAASALAQYAHLLKNLDDAEIEQLMKLEAKAEKEGALTPEDASKMSEIQNKIHEVWRRSTGRGRGAANEEKRAAELGIAMGPAEQRKAQKFYRDESAARSDILSLDAYMEQFGRKTEGVTPARIAAQMGMTLEKYNKMRALYQKFSYSQYETTPAAEMGTTTQEEYLKPERQAEEQNVERQAAILAARGLLAEYPFVPGFPPKPEAKALDLIIQALREGRGLASDDSIERRSALTRAAVGVLLAKVGQSARLLLEDPWEAAALEAELAALPVQGQKLISNRGRRG